MLFVGWQSLFQEFISLKQRYWCTVNTQTFVNVWRLYWSLVNVFQHFDKHSTSPLTFFCLPQDQGGLGIAISEEDTTNGVVIKSLTDHGAAAKVGERLKSK